jgi:hypothetical protein
MDINIGAQYDYSILLQDLMKRGVGSCGVEMALQYAMPLNEWTIYSTFR